MHLEDLASLILVAIVAFSLISGWISRSLITMPMIFIAVGFAMSSPLSATGEQETLQTIVRYLAEMALILTLFSDASRVDISKLKMQAALPVRMLLIGLPLTIAVGTLVVLLINPMAGLAMAVLTAAVLSPTDAALGQSIVSDPNVPEKLGQTINVESGLNDGLVLPFVLIGAVIASGHMSVDQLPSTIAYQLLLGPAVGIALGWVLAAAMEFSHQRNWMMESAQGVIFLASAFLMHQVAELIGGNGFLAAFSGGLVFGSRYCHERDFIGEFMEGVGQLLAMAAFLAFGALLLPAGLSHISWMTLLLAFSFLTVVRIVPIWISLWGSGLSNGNKLFLGWFGPRGLASILFTLIIVDEYELTNETELMACVSLTVLLSVVFHGLSATPLARRLAKTR